MLVLAKHVAAVCGMLFLIGTIVAPTACLALGPDDPVLVGQTFLAGTTNPMEGSAAWALVSHGVAEKLFTVDQTGEIVGQVGTAVTKIDDLVWEVTLAEGTKFSDGTDVTAEHVADALNDLNTNNSNAQSSLGAMTVTPQANGKVRIESERSTHVMDAVLAEWVFVIYKPDDADSGNFVFTGPYAIQSFGEDAIELVPNRYYDSKSLDRPLVTLQKFGDGNALAESAKNGDVDIGFHLPIDTLPDLREADGVSVKSFEVGYHYMMFHNMDPGSVLSDANVRKAIDTAIDRTALSQALSGGTATRSLFPDYSPYFFDESDQHGDSESAEALLDASGWMPNSETGKREKDGEELTINLVAYPHRPGLVIMQPVIADALTDLGITVNSITTSQDWDETQTIIDDRSFDLLMWAQHTLPAGDPLWFLSAFFRTEGGNNHSKLSSSEIDSMLDSLSLAEEHPQRVALAQSTQEAILSQVPVSNLVTPFWHVSLSDRMADYEPWGSDYYVIRPDLFVKEIAIPDAPEEAPEPVVKPASVSMDDKEPSSDIAVADDAADADADADADTATSGTDSDESLSSSSGSAIHAVGSVSALVAFVVSVSAMGVF